MKPRIMTREMIDALGLEVGDSVRVTVNEAGYSEVGDIATLTRQDDDGDWWGALHGDEICLTDVGLIEPA